MALRSSLFHLAVGSAGGNADIGSLHGDDDAAAAGNDLERMTGGGDGDGLAP